MTVGANGMTRLDADLGWYGHDRLRPAAGFVRTGQEEEARRTGVWLRLPVIGLWVSVRRK